MGLPSNTSRSSMIELIKGKEDGVGETTIRYSVFATDSFESQSSTTFYDSPGHTNFLDGMENDDSYRNSRHLVNKKGVGSELSDNLRENSLARQLQDKPDRQATIRLIRRTTVTGVEKFVNKLTRQDKGAPWTNLIPPNTKFFLETVQENRDEKVQVIDTFGEWVAFFFGRKPEVYTYSGTLLNAANHNWKNEFQENYDNFLRGSEAVKNKAIVVLMYDDVIVEGYIMNTSIQMVATQDKAVPFSFSMLVTKRSPIDPRDILMMRKERSIRGILTATEERLLALMDESLKVGVRPDGTLDDSNLHTFLLMREFFAGNYTPEAGVIKMYHDSNLAEPEGSKLPGAVGGSNDEPRESSGFDQELQKKLELLDVPLGGFLDQDKLG